MKIQALGPWVCPLDGAPLQDSVSGARCDSGHLFDRAKQGYLNLLPVQHKASRDPGDDKAMVVARRRVLDDGLFLPIADAVAAFVYQHATAAISRLRVVDAGCGEGYYLDHLLAAAEQWSLVATLHAAGYDISKSAVRAAARRRQDVNWAVASNRQPPVARGSVDVVLSLFGFPHWPQFEAMLAPQGLVLLVDAGADHLLELREIIYPKVVRAAPSPPADALARGWLNVFKRPLDYGMTLTSAEQIQALLAMTPHAHRISAAGREALCAMTRLNVTVNVVLRAMARPVTASAA